MTCSVCELISDEKNTIISDEISSVFLARRPLSKAHSIVAPKKHYVILDQVPDEDIEHLFKIANIISVSLFQMLGSEGTNIIIENGVEAGQTIPHFMINIIPRKKDDGINFVFNRYEAEKDELEGVSLLMREGFKKLNEKKVVFEENHPKEISKKDPGNKEKLNYLIEHLKRIP